MIENWCTSVHPRQHSPSTTRKRVGRTILAGKERLALEHLGEDAACGPDVDGDVVFLPGEHDFGGAVVAGGDVARHLRILNAGEAEIADLEVAILIDEDVARFLGAGYQFRCA